MSYEKMTIADAMRKITENAYYLPAIQRKFVWDADRIPHLFDSLLRGYPIGTFLFWEIPTARRNDYVLYQFIKDYDERQPERNIQAVTPHLGERQLTGVLDGQQRLTSMYVALQGSYTKKRKYSKKRGEAAYERLELYINLLHVDSEADDDGEGDDLGARSRHQFRFLPFQEARRRDDHHHWYRVRDVLELQDAGAVQEEFLRIRGEHPILSAKAANLLGKLQICLCLKENISYFMVKADSLDEITDIFVRVNSGGKPLSRTDLMFSTIIARWEEGRELIEDLLFRLNEKGTGFDFDTDFVMRSCLVLLDLPVLFKVDSFRAANIERIRSQWDRIADAIAEAVDIIVALGFTREYLTAKTVVIPIAYHRYHGGDLVGSRPAIRQFVLRSLLKGVFGSKTDQALQLIRGRLEASLKRSPVLPIDEVIALELPEHKTLRVDHDIIDEMLERRYGKEAFLVLAVLYEGIRFDQRHIHQDHLHPASHFKSASLKALGLTKEQIETFQERRDRLPNLQFLEGGENQSKSAATLCDWVGEMDAAAAIRFREDNFIPADASLAFEDFEHFYEARKMKMRAELVRLLGVTQ
jgi:hypothetical protein